MDREVFVYVDLDGGPHLMGKLWARVRKDKESAPIMAGPRERAGRVKTAKRRRGVLMRPGAPE